MIRTPLLALLALATASLAAISDEVEPPNDRLAFSFYFENDLFSDTDRYYTNGARASFLSSDLEALKLPHWAQQVKDLCWFLDRDGFTNNIGLAFGQEIYTPEDISQNALIEDDRPYAGWLYTAISLHHKSDSELHKLELALGVVGPQSLAEGAQNYVHSERNIPRARGWDNQLRTEVGAILTYEHQRRYALRSSQNWGSDLIPAATISIGNVLTQASARVTLRGGYHLPEEFHANRIRVSGYVQPTHRNGTAAQDWSIYAFSTLEMRGVLRDITLDGNSTKDSHRVDRIPLVGELELGMGVRYRRYRLVYSHVLRTEEFEQQHNSQKFGSLGLVIEF